MFQARGSYQAGYNQAHRNLTRQVPLIVAGGFPEIEDFHRATINVCFERRIIPARSDYRTAPIPWGDDPRAGEVFDFIRVRLLFSDLACQVRGLMYIAHGSPFRNLPHVHEFLADRYIDGLQINTPVVMECDREAEILPYIGGVIDSTGKFWPAETIVIL